MIIDLVSDWPAYVFICIFVFFVAYVIIKGNSGDAASQKKEDIFTNKK